MVRLVTNDADTIPSPPGASEGGGELDGAKARQILEGARAVFLARGFDGASMADIAKAAKVSKGTLYVYFASKEALFEALVRDERRALAEVLFRLDASNPDTRAVLRDLGISYVTMMARPDHVASVRMVIGVAEKFPALGRLFHREGPEQGRARLEAYLDTQVDAGRLAIADTGRAATEFLDLCASGILRALLFGGETPTRARIAENVEAALRLFYAAYGPHPRDGG